MPDDNEKRVRRTQGELAQDRKPLDVVAVSKAPESSTSEITDTVGGPHWSADTVLDDFAENKEIRKRSVDVT
ncbi:hypothetical protein GCM10009000_083340 [Halobacterium noricense]|uniref:Uncharacterized protein n=1 Tax=Haladaptatus pallidirubidus TaxID=1008152 RepID=A0AAV3UQH6_9EURY